MPDTAVGNFEAPRGLKGLGPELIIFDCDGVLVDSEPLSFRVLSETITAAGASIPLEDCYRLFLGKSIHSMREILGRDYGTQLSDADLAEMQARLFEVYRQELCPIPGIANLLEKLQQPFCVASSGLPERIRLALELTGLLPAFEPHVFSATMVERGKPAPDLFLHAAAEMDTPPARCLVIEDSTAGIEAAQSAGMTVIGFTGGSHAQMSGYREKLEALQPDAVISDLAELAAFL